MAPTTLRGWRDDLEELQAALLAARVGAQTNGEKATALEVRTETLEGELASERARSAKLEKQVEKLQRELASMKRRAIGPKSERMPTPEDEARKLEPPVAPGGNTNPEKRAANRERLKALPTRCVPHRIPDCERRCPSCGEEVRPIGSGDRSYEIEWTPGHLERRVHVVETGRCPCKMHYARGPAPERVTQGCSFGPGFIAKLAVEKCGDAIPVYRMEKAMRRAGIPVSRSTMNRQLLLAGRALLPLWQAAYDLMRVDAHVQADETSFRLQGQKARAFVWTFLTKDYCIYVFSPSRSGETAGVVLGGTTGTLTVDGYTGYNRVTDVAGRERTGCWSHVRRYLFEAMQSAPEARDGLDLILQLFMIERAARRGRFFGTQDHLALRQARSLPILGNILAWMRKTAPKYEPSSAMGEALRYMRNQWFRLTAFLDDAEIPIHNNASEAALRIIALARKNSLFFGSKSAAQNLMVLYSLIAMCDGSRSFVTGKLCL